MKTHPKITSQLSQTTVTLRKSTVQQEIHHHNKLHCALYHVLFMWRHMATVTLTLLTPSWPFLNIVSVCDKINRSCWSALSAWKTGSGGCTIPAVPHLDYGFLVTALKWASRKGDLKESLLPQLLTIIKTEIIDLMQRLRALWWSGWRG